MAGLYLPLIVGKTYEYEHCQAAWDARDAPALLAWLGRTWPSLREQGQRLLHRARAIDPIAPWEALTSQMARDAWDRVRGDVLVAHDYRVAAKTLNRFDDDLVIAGVAAPPTRAQENDRDPMVPELARRVELDEVLMEFGLSPHPSAIVAVEGQTEALLLPRVLDRAFGESWRTVIYVFDAKGVDKALEALVAYAITPRFGQAHGTFIELSRPPARFIVVTDPEGQRATPAKRKKQRRVWLRRLYEATDSRYRTPILCRELMRLVDILPWDDQGQSFEFANFSDTELADALIPFARSDGIDRATLVATIADHRRRRLNFDRVWRRWSIVPSKLVLAEQLWPLLDEDLGGDPADWTGPIGQVVRRVLERALTLPRTRVGIRT